MSQAVLFVAFLILNQLLTQNAAAQYLRKVCVLLWMLAHRHDGLSSVMAIVMRKIYPLGSLNKTQSTWLLMSRRSVRELKDLTETGDNHEPDRIRPSKTVNPPLQLFKTFIIKLILQTLDSS